MSSDTSNLPNIEPYTIEPINDDYSVTDGYYSDGIEADYQGSSESKRKLPLPLPILLALIFGILAILIFLLIALTRKGTGEPVPGDINNGNTNNNQSVQIRWVGAFLDEDVVNPLIQEYEALNPNVDIQYFNQWPLDKPFTTAERDYRNELNSLFLDPLTSPDIFMVNNTWTQEFLVKAYPSPIISAEAMQSSYYPAVTTDFVNGGLVYGVPFWIDTLALVYNEDLLITSTNQNINPPDEWPGFRLFAESISDFSADNPIAGFAAGNPSNTSFAFELINLLMIQNNVQISTVDGVPVFANDSDVLSTFNFYKSFLSSPKTWESSFSYDATGFSEGRVAMVLATSWRYKDILRANDQFNLGLNIGIKDIPQLEDQSVPLLNWATYWGSMVNKESFYPEESWAFLEWMSRPEQLQKLYKNQEEKDGYFGFLYARSDMANLIENDEYFSVYVDSLPSAFSWKIPKGIETRDLFFNTLSGSITSASIQTLQDDIKLLWEGVAAERLGLSAGPQV
ncbi:MAG: extracellular solute-binding protein [Candidatus Dojkabacteria bacterium]|nr:extracellular solute-binding protein [Candidatus Dojkabacteria bacterium]